MNEMPNSLPEDIEPWRDRLLTDLWEDQLVDELWGGVDEMTFIEYEAGTLDPEERARVDQAIIDHPALGESLESYREFQKELLSGDPAAPAILPLPLLESPPSPQNHSMSIATDPPAHWRMPTLIEGFVTLGIIGFSIALIFPAVQNARSAARRAQCVSNMQQLGLAIDNYIDIHNAYPLGSYMMPPPGDPLAGPCSGRYEQSILVRLLPNLEEGQLYNAYNNNVHYSDAANTTVQTTGLKALWCPSDPTVENTDYSQSPFGMRFSSYRGNSGTWFSPSRYADPGCLRYDFNAQIEQANGIFYFYSSTTKASITDGLSNTMLMGEFAHGKLSAGEQSKWGWWNAGDYGQTMFTSSYPLNPFERAGQPGTEKWANPELNASAASSYHPGGANFLFCDGSVRFIKDTIQQGPANSATAFADNVEVSAGNVYRIRIGSQMSVYQRLSTRNGGDFVPDESY